MYTHYKWPFIVLVMQQYEPEILYKTKVTGLQTALKLCIIKALSSPDTILVCTTIHLRINSTAVFIQVSLQACNFCLIKDFRLTFAMQAV